MRRSASAAVLIALATIPAGCAATTSQPAPAPRPTATPAPVSGAGAGTRTIAGPSVDMQWGPVQVTISVKGKRITDVQASAPTERPRSAFINDQAVPLLRQETLQAQNAQIDLISGATLTSEAYDESLQGAIDQARI